MYSESDIDNAVTAGALSAEAAAAFRAHVAGERAAPLADEESFRLVTGFNDIFVTIATILLLVAVGWIGNAVGDGIFPLGSPLRFAAAAFLGSGGIAAASWLLAEYFTRQRRMALPSIVLLLSFALGMSGMVFGAATLVIPKPDDRTMGLIGAVAGLVTAGATLAHWRRFHVPITVAALTVALVGATVGVLVAILPGVVFALNWLLLFAGIAVFLFAMRWDMSDRRRQTRRSDVAFWLHLAAAPMIAHPIFWTLGVMTQGFAGPKALAVVGLYAVFGLIALAVDRRALLVSSLFYVLYALSELLRQFGAVSLNVALTALVIGSGLLMLSAFWTPIRRVVVGWLPVELQAKLPVVDRAVAVAA